MGKYDEDAAAALELLAEFGERSTLNRVTPGAPPDPARPWEPGTPTQVDEGLDAVWLNQSILRDGDTAKAGEAFVIVGAVAPPDPTLDRVTRADGTVYSIVSVEPLAPGGQLVISELRVRR